MSDVYERIREWLARDAIEIAKREPVDCIMRSCRSTRQCGFQMNCSRKYETPAVSGVEEKK